MYGQYYNTDIMIQGYRSVDTRDVIFENEHMEPLYNSIDVFKKRAEYNLRMNMSGIGVKTANGLSAYFSAVDIPKLLHTPYGNPMSLPDSGNPNGSILFSVAQLQAINLFKEETDNFHRDNYAYNRRPFMDDSFISSLLYDTHNKTVRATGSYRLTGNAYDLRKIHPTLKSENIVGALEIQDDIPTVLEKMEEVSVSTINHFKKIIQEQQANIYDDELNDALIRWNIRKEAELGKEIPDKDDLKHIGILYYRHGQIAAAHPYKDNCGARKNYDRFMLDALRDEFEMTAYMILAEDYNIRKFQKDFLAPGREAPDFGGKFRDSLPQKERSSLISYFSKTFEETVMQVHPSNKVLTYPVTKL